MGGRLRMTQKVTSTRVRRPSKIRPMMRGSKMDWSLGQEKPGGKIGQVGITMVVVGIKVEGGRREWGMLGSRRLVRGWLT